MENKEYFLQGSELFMIFEDMLDDFEYEIDYYPTPDKLMVTFENNSEKIVINTQRAIKEIWLAGNSRGWHFQFMQEKGIWFANAEQEEFYQCLAKLLSENLGTSVSFE